MPASELESRIAAFQAELRAMGLAGALVVQLADLYYLSGTSQDAHLLVPASGEAVLRVRRSLSRARAESALSRVEPLTSLRELPLAFEEEGLTDGPLGLELDVIPTALYLNYSHLLPGFDLHDCSPALRRLRSRKSPWELARTREAAAMLSLAFDAVPQTLRAGMTEIELSAEIEMVLRKAGHQGTIRVRAFNQELHYGAILAGPSAAAPGGSNAAIVGPGPNAAIGKGASPRPIQRNEPIVVDLVGASEGYLADQTRTFSLGRVDEFFRDAYDHALFILHTVAGEAEPGVAGAHLWERAWELAADREGFMGGQDEHAVSFVGHGLGLELDEPPFLARSWDSPLEDGMVFALEPKFVRSGFGAVGVENTYALVDGMIERLTETAEELIELP